MLLQRRVSYRYVLQKERGKGEAHGEIHTFHECLVHIKYWACQSKYNYSLDWNFLF